MRWRLMVFFLKHHEMCEYLEDMTIRFLTCQHIRYTFVEVLECPATAVVLKNKFFLFLRFTQTLGPERC